MTFSTNNSPSLASVLGMGAFRSALVNSLTYPLEVVKTNQQVHTSPISSYMTAKNLFKSDRFFGFYRGFSAQFAKGMIRQMVWWPAIAYIPPALQKRNVSSLGQNVITGVSIATADALLNAPLERVRVQSSIQSNSLKGRAILADGWKGFFPYWRRQSISWPLLLIGQHHFNKPYKKEQNHLTNPQVLATSTKLSLIAAGVIAPFDTLNTLKQSGSSQSFQSWNYSTRNPATTLRLLYRGFPVNFLSTLIQTTGTVFLIDKLERKNKFQ